MVDIVFELVDARIPLSSRNPMIAQILKNKPRLVLMTKATMADSSQNSFWQNYFKGENVESLLIDSITGLNTNKIVTKAREVVKEKLEKEAAKGMKPRAIRAMVVGIPNVGKSTLINKIVNKKVANVENRPGVTKSQQWIRINKDLDLIDTPGVLWPKFDDQRVGFHLAITGAIKDDIIIKDDLIVYLLDYLKKYYPSSLEKYNVSIEEENVKILDKIAANRGFFLNDGYDYEKVYDAILNDFRSNKLGKITLDRTNYD